MKILIEYPPNLAMIQSYGLCPNPMVTAFTYGDILYNPGNARLEQHFMKHEECHAVQQGNDPERWWIRYCTDAQFRIQQEAEAFAVQYLFHNKYVNHDRNAQFKFLHKISNSLAGATYGNAITPVLAMRLIQSYAGRIKI